jgi:hypothetical protein
MKVLRLQTFSGEPFYDYLTDLQSTSNSVFFITHAACFWGKNFGGYIILAFFANLEAKRA